MGVEEALSTASDLVAEWTALEERIPSADAWVSLGRGVSPQFAALFTTIEGVQSAEAWTLADGAVAETPARLWGIPSETLLYRYVLREGRWYRPDAFGPRSLEDGSREGGS